MVDGLALDDDALAISDITVRLNIKPAIGEVVGADFGPHLEDKNSWGHLATMLRPQLFFNNDAGSVGQLINQIKRESGSTSLCAGQASRSSKMRSAPGERSPSSPSRSSDRSTEAGPSATARRRLSDLDRKGQHQASRLRAIVVHPMVITWTSVYVLPMGDQVKATLGERQPCSTYLATVHRGSSSGRFGACGAQSTSPLSHS